MENKIIKNKIKIKNQYKEKQQPLFPQRVNPKVDSKLSISQQERGTLLLFNSRCSGDKNKHIAQKGNCSP